MREYFEMSLDDLREVAAWAAGFAERALAVYEERVPGDARPRLALEGAKEFARGGGRTNALRKLAMDAYRASREAVDGAASEAANAASLAAALPFTHPFRDLRQAEHLLGPVVHAALALEDGALAGKGEALLDEAARAAGGTVAGLLRNFPRRGPGASRRDQAFHRLESDILGFAAGP